VTLRQSPTVRRRRLAIELRRMRDAAGLTIEQVAKALECSDSKVSRIETAQVGATPRDVRDMLELYGVEGQQREALVQIAREARQRGWWQAYGDAFEEATYVGFEVAVASIRTYEALLVPGLLQTTEYARALIRALRPDWRDEDVERRVELRMTRQRLLSDSDPPALWAVIDESALRRWVGGREVMRRQLHHLVEVATLPTVTLQVVRFSAGEHGGMAGAFTILGFPEAVDPEVVYLENLASDVYLDRPEEIRRYAHLFNYLRSVALKPDDSTVRIDILAGNL
jgi:transcriptional regulator with XRE-family HTH domain